MARVLIVGCGCRGRELAGALVSEGHAVRGTSRDPGTVEAIDAAGAQGAVADPGRLTTLISQLEGVSVLVWLMGSATGDREDVAALHGPRLESLLDHLVDTPVRGFVYEGAGPVQRGWLEQGAAAVRQASVTHRMPAEVAATDPADREAWLGAMVEAVRRVLSG